MPYSPGQEPETDLISMSPIVQNTGMEDSKGHGIIMEKDG